MPLLIYAVALDREKIDILYHEDFFNQVMRMPATSVIRSPDSEYGSNSRLRPFKNHLSVIAQIGRVGLVSRDCPKFPFHPNQSEVIAYRDSTVIEKDVMIWTQAQHIPEQIGAIVWRTEGMDVRSLSIGADRCFHAYSTDLAAIIVQLLHLKRNSGVTDNPIA